VGERRTLITGSPKESLDQERIVTPPGANFKKFYPNSPKESLDQERIVTIVA